MLHTLTDLSSPAVTNRLRSDVITIPVTDVLLFRLTIFWLRLTENTLIFLSYDPVAMCLPSSKSTMLVTAA